MKPVEDLETFPDALEHLAESHGISEKTYYLFFDRDHSTLEQIRYDHEYLHEEEDLDVPDQS